MSALDAAHGDSASPLSAPPTSRARAGCPQAARLLAAVGRRQLALLLALSSCVGLHAAQVAPVRQAAPVRVIRGAGTGEPSDDDENLPSFALPTLSEVDRESYIDFQRFSAEGDWSRAFRSIEAQLESPPHGLVDASSGSVRFSWPEQLRRDLVAMPPEGRRAFRLFHDAHAASLLELARDPDASEVDRRANARMIYDAWYPTSSGDDAADLLARIALDEGRPAAAARLWRALLREHPDTDLDRSRLRLDLITALGAAGDRPRFEAEAARARARHAGGTVTRGGVELELETWLASVTPTEQRPAWPPLIEGISLDDRPEPRWRVRFERYRPEHSGSSYQQPPRPVPPPTALYEDLLLVSRDGEVDGLSLADGERRWSFGRQPSLSRRVGQAARFPLLGRPGLWIAGTNPMGARGEPQAELMSFDPATGEHERVGPQEGAWSERHTLGVPAFGAGGIFAVIGEESSYLWHLSRLDLPSGELGWFVELGAPAASAGNNPWMFGGNPTSLPVRPCLEVVGDELYVMSDAGALLSADVDSGLLRWALAYPISQRFDQAASPGSMLVIGGLLYFRSAGCPELFALDPSGPELLWRASIGRDERIVAVDQEHVYLAGDELRAVSRADGERVWSRPLMLAAGTGGVQQSSTSLWVLTRRGLFEIDKQSGHHVRVWRGDLARMGGGDLLWSQAGLLAVGPDEVLSFGGPETLNDEESSGE